MAIAIKRINNFFIKAEETFSFKNNSNILFSLLICFFIALGNLEDIFNSQIILSWKEYKLWWNEFKCRNICFFHALNYKIKLSKAGANRVLSFWIFCLVLITKILIVAYLYWIFWKGVFGFIGFILKCFTIKNINASLVVELLKMVFILWQICLFVG